MPPRSSTACDSLPPEGAAFRLGAARRRNPRVATLLPLKGATPAARQSRFCGVPRSFGLPSISTVRA
ncbi:MAG TPA: hypothetical protein DHV21_01535 [Curvibacter sp.]|nr:hypothetical protein [Curvibacter sp.]